MDLTPDRTSPKRRRAYIAGLCLAATASLTGCAGFGQPEPLVRSEPPAYTDYLAGQQRLQQAAVDPQWWRSFGDPVLESLVDQALAQNIDLAIALSRIEQARADRRAETARFGPRLDFNASISGQRLSENSTLPAGRIPGFETQNVIYEAGFDAEWELDLLGRNKLRSERADARFLLAEAEQDAALVMVISDLAREYVEYRLAQQEATSLEAMVSSQRNIFAMVERRRQQGEASNVELEREAVALSQTEARLPEVRARLRGSLYRLDVLTGQVPGTLAEQLAPSAALPDIPDAVPMGLASDLLRRRADVRTAEANYVIAERDRSLADLDLLPSFSLFGSAGTETTDLAAVFDPASFVGTIAGIASWALFDNGERAARRASTRAASEQAALAYRGAVLAALEDVEGSAARFVEIARESDKRSSELASRERLSRFEQRRFEKGTANRVEVERSAIAAIEAGLRSRRAHAQALINLFALQKAFGGSWKVLAPTQPDSLAAAE